MNEVAILGFDKTLISKVESDEIVNWAASKTANAARDMVNHSIAELVAKVANLELNIDSYPNQKETKTELIAAATRARNFLEVLAELKDNKYTHKTKIVINNL